MSRRHPRSTLFPTRRSSDLTAIAVDPTNPNGVFVATSGGGVWYAPDANGSYPSWSPITESLGSLAVGAMDVSPTAGGRSEEHTSELQSHVNLVCRLLLEKKN